MASKTKVVTAYTRPGFLMENAGRLRQVWMATCGNKQCLNTVTLDVVGERQLQQCEDYLEGSGWGYDGENWCCPYHRPEDD